MEKNFSLLTLHLKISWFDVHSIIIETTQATTKNKPTELPLPCAYGDQR